MKYKLIMNCDDGYENNWIYHKFSDDLQELTRKVKEMYSKYKELTPYINFEIMEADKMG